MARYGFRDFTTCQHMSLYDQYRAGIRFVEIGCRLYGESIPVHLGAWFQQAFPTKDVLKPTMQFLHENPSEMIIMLIKYENHMPSKGRLEFDQLVESALNNGGANWMDTMPETLGEGRGKIVVLNKDWPSKDTLGTNISSFDVFDSQDEHDKQKMWEKIENRLRKVQEKDGGRICITYVSGYCNWMGGVLADRFAMREYLNPRLNDYCKQNADRGPMGIVLSDSPEKGWDFEAFLSGNQ